MSTRKVVKVVGLMGGLAFTSVILATWISSTSDEQPWFRAGEPNTALKHSEWLLGGLSIVGMWYALKDTLESSD